ncbi:MULTISPECIES: ferrous iron transport protein A [unclassified Vagococcus]|uniref:FeoA family protein n=1 Tax=unclassified Vagococcus TaxID=2648499 RepID=UPI0021123C05|nr:MULTISPECIES: ferrous iron transport protein A [unclassified Vagococcus]MCI0130910.1 ferrous iron transport protein A [Vagococcus sp. CY53-2]
MKKLKDCQMNKVYQFVAFNGQESHGKHLKNLGLLPGTEMVLLSNKKNQPFIVLFKGTKIGIDDTIAEFIQVSEDIEKNSTNLKTLDEIGIGKHAQVIDFTASGALKRRLMDMGLTKGVLIQVKQYAPLGDPIEMTVRGYELSLRKQEASLILVKEV